MKFVMTRLEGLAREAILTDPLTVDDIVTQLKEGIKLESSKVIEGRILALRADRSSLTKFSEQAEKLADQFKRSLCLEGFSREKAKEIAIEKTVEIYRKSAKDDTVKALLEASKFSEVIAKMIVEINNLKQEKPENSFAHKLSNSNKNSQNPNRGHHSNRGNYRNANNGNRHNNNDHTGNRSHQNNSNHFRGHGQSNFSNRNNSRRQNENPIRQFSGNDIFPENGGQSTDQ